MNPNLKNRIPENIFQNTTTSYKFFWCMSILELHKLTGKTIFDFDDIFARMISEAWMILNKYQINLGGADHLKYSINSLIRFYPKNFSSIQSIYAIITENYSRNKSIKRILRYYDGNVPFRFLTPWVGTKIQRGDLSIEELIYQLDVPYSIHTSNTGHYIKLNPSWSEVINGQEDYLISLVIEQFLSYIRRRNTCISTECINHIYDVFGVKPITKKDEYIETDNSIDVYDNNTFECKVEYEELSDTTHQLCCEKVVSTEQYVDNKHTTIQSTNNDIIIDGKVIQICDSQLLNRLIPVLKESKLDAISLLSKYYENRDDVSMSFVDWGRVIESISCDVKDDESSTDETVVNTSTHKLLQHPIDINEDIIEYFRLDNNVKLSKYYNILERIDKQFWRILDVNLNWTHKKISVQIRNVPGYCIHLTFSGVKSFKMSGNKHTEYDKVEIFKDGGMYRYKFGRKTLSILSNKAQITEIDHL